MTWTAGGGTLSTPGEGNDKLQHRPPLIVVLRCSARTGSLPPSHRATAPTHTALLKTTPAHDSQLPLLSFFLLRLVPVQRSALFHSLFSLSLHNSLHTNQSIHPSVRKKIFCTAPCGLLFRRTAHRSRPTTDYFFAISTTPLSLLHMPSPLLYVLASHLEPEEERSNSFLLRAH